MAHLNVYLNFNGNCREAMTFYQECLGGELKMQAFGESPMAGQTPPEMQKNIIHSSLEKDGLVLMAADIMGTKGVIKGNTMYLCMIGSSKEEIAPAFSKLSEGGIVHHPLKEEFFGTFGELTDKFGIDWMFQANNKANA
jgi:PhnB protein